MMVLKYKKAEKTAGGILDKFTGCKWHPVRTFLTLTFEVFSNELRKNSTHVPNKKIEMGPEKLQVI